MSNIDKLSFNDASCERPAPDCGAGLPCAWGGPLGHGRLRACNADFQVEEILGFEPDGEGEHLLWQIRKDGVNTTDVARHIARLGGVRPGEVGYCGLKDRHAVATQWFSLPLGGRAAPSWTPPPGMAVELLRAQRHRRKLRPGSHSANRFVLTLRELPAATEAREQRLQRLAGQGFPNYFGEQRFGRAGANPARARAMLAGHTRVRRAQRGLLLSALRASLFNRVLAARVADASWNRAAPGEVVMLEGSHSVFTAPHGDSDLDARLRALDLHPTGPLCGRARDPVAALSEREAAILAPFAADLEALAGAGLRAARRALRARARALHWWQPAAGVLSLEFVLAPGVYATSLVRELMEH